MDLVETPANYYDADKFILPIPLNNPDTYIPSDIFTLAAYFTKPSNFPIPFQFLRKTNNSNSDVSSQYATSSTPTAHATLPPSLHQMRALLSPTHSERIQVECSEFSRNGRNLEGIIFGWGPSHLHSDSDHIPTIFRPIPTIPARTARIPRPTKFQSDPSRFQINSE